jgi:hypothetical protein
MTDDNEVNPQIEGLMVEIINRLAELRNALILAGLANSRTDSPGNQQTAATALAKLREMADAFNL